MARMVIVACLHVSLEGGFYQRKNCPREHEANMTWLRLHSPSCLSVTSCDGGPSGTFYMEALYSSGRYIVIIRYPGGPKEWLGTLQQPGLSARRV